MTDELINPLIEEADAIRRIALTHDGRLLHRYFRRILEAVFDMPPEGALLAQNGRRSLARDVMALMAEGIESSAHRTDSARSSPADESILARAGKPSAVRPRTGAGRRVALEPGDGWQPGDTPSATGGTS